MQIWGRFLGCKAHRSPLQLILVIKINYLLVIVKVDEQMYGYKQIIQEILDAYRGHLTEISLWIQKMHEAKSK